MNKKQKWLVLVSIIIFLFVTLNPTVFRMKPADGVSKELGWPIYYRPYFASRPMYQNWAVIAIPAIALYYYFQDKKH